MRPRLPHPLIPLLVLASLVGCRPKDQIRTYRVAKAPEASPPTTPEPRPAEVEAPGPPTDRMIGSIVRGSDQAWFFKAVGPKETLDASADAIFEFLKSVRLEGGKPTWDAPEGWNPGPEKPMRLATLMIPGGDSETELSVIGLPLTGDWQTQVLNNVNRWRKQLKEPPLALADLAEETTPLTEVSEDAVLFDEVGRFDGGTMAPFARDGATPPTRPRQPSPPPVRSPPSTDLTYDTPDGWTADRKPNPIRKASLTTDGGAAITAFVFPAAGAMSDPLENVNRWRGEVGLAATTAEALAQASEEIELLGKPGQRFEIVGEAEATTAAMVQIDQGIWFFKLRGPKEEVANQGDAFDAWLKSLSL